MSIELAGLLPFAFVLAIVIWATNGPVVALIGERVGRVLMGVIALVVLVLAFIALLIHVID